MVLAIIFQFLPMQICVQSLSTLFAPELQTLQLFCSSCLTSTWPAMSAVLFGPSHHCSEPAQSSFLRIPCLPLEQLLSRQANKEEQTPNNKGDQRYHSNKNKLIAFYLESIYIDTVSIKTCTEHGVINWKRIFQEIK